MSLIKVIYVQNKRTEELLERIAVALEKLVPPATEVGEIKIEEISGIIEAKTEQEILDEQTEEYY